MGRRVLVTGGSRGIGAAIVRAFRTAGDGVVFTCSRESAEARAVAEETGASFLVADNRDEGAVANAVAEAERILGGTVGILVNNAGVAYTGLLSEMSLSDWNNVINVNLGGTFLYSRAVIPGMVQDKTGKIINISSVWGTVGSSCEVAYSASKAAVIGFTRALAKELGPSGITVNAVAPGVIETRMIGELDREAREALKEETPLSRIGKPEDVAAAVLYLSGEGGDFVTGQVLSVNGGFSIA